MRNGRFLCNFSGHHPPLRPEYVIFFYIRDSHKSPCIFNIVEKVYLGPGTNMYICNGSTLPAIYDKIFVAKLVNEAIMFILAVYKGISSLKQYKGPGTASKLLVVLVKDSALYFLV